MSMEKSELVRQTKAAKEIESSFRLYIREWIYVGRHPIEEESNQDLNAMFGGRVRPEDMQTVKDWDGSWLMMVRRWNLAAEVKTEVLAAEFLDALMSEGYEAQMVGRNSRAEHSLVQYGVTLLPRTSNANL